MWGAEAASFDAVEGSLDRVLDAVPSLEALRSRLEANPDLARWEAELRLRRAALASEKAARIPDLEASVGYLQYDPGTERVSELQRQPEQSRRHADAPGGHRGEPAQPRRD